MFNAEKPSLEDLPSSAQLIRSTIVAAFSAAAILVTIVLPAEYGIDPTGLGRVLGLAEMGEIKQELADEAERDHQSDAAPGGQMSVVGGFFGLFVSTAQAQQVEVWSDELTFNLSPGQTYEVKLAMNEGETASYRMVVEGGRVNFDLHAHGASQSITYERGRGSRGSEGQIEAAFTGDHGWFFRNRDDQDLTVTLQVRGTYSELKQGS